MDKELPKRKSPRLKYFDYSSEGAYFVTICVNNKMHILSEIQNITATGTNHIMVGEGLAPPEISIKLKHCGRIAKEQLQALEIRYKNITVDDFIIMPDHIHAIIFLNEQTGGASPSPTLNDVICTFKSLTSRICKQQCGIEKIFQRSFFEHIIRDKTDYETRKKYIHENPIRWYYKNQCE